MTSMDFFRGDPATVFLKKASVVLLAIAIVMVIASIVMML